MTVCHVFYDLAVSPASYDFMTFLQCAELHRKRYKFQKIILYIVPGPNKGFREDNLHCPLDERRMMLRNIVIPIPHILPSVEGIVWYKKREDFNVSIDTKNNPYTIFPRGYNLHQPTNCYSQNSLNISVIFGERLTKMDAPKEYHEMVRRYFLSLGEHKKIVTITTRENPDFPTRNSNLMAWDKFCRELQSRGYFPIVIRETEKAYVRDCYFDGIEQSELAAINILFRTALYQNAYLNLSVSNGTTSCAFHTDASFIMYKVLTPENYSTTEEFVEKIMGIKVGSQVPFLTKKQLYVWEDDNLEVIRKYFDHMCNNLENKNDLDDLHGVQMDEENINVFYKSVLLHLLQFMPHGIWAEDIAVLNNIKMNLPNISLKNLIKQLFKEHADEIIAKIDEIDKTVFA